MELCTLRERLEAGEMSIPTVMRVLLDVCAGLVCLHKNGIVHCDLTTSNVMLTDEEVPRAKIADVAVSKSVHEDNPALAACLNPCPGTCTYMPFEAVVESSNCLQYDEKLDIFSFGVLAMATLLRREPDKSLVEAPYFFQQENGRWAIMSETWRHRADFGWLVVDHPLTHIVRRCLENYPERRPSACELYVDLVEVAFGVPRCDPKTTITADIESTQRQLGYNDEELRQKAKMLSMKEGTVADLQVEPGQEQLPCKYCGRIPSLPPWAKKSKSRSGSAFSKGNTTLRMSRLLKRMFKPTSVMYAQF